MGARSKKPNSGLVLVQEGMTYEVTLVNAGRDDREELRGHLRVTAVVHGKALMTIVGEIIESGERYRIHIGAGEKA